MAMRVYQAWKGNNVFLFGGRFIFAPDATLLPLTIALILVPTLIFCQFVARYFLQYFYAGYAILTIAVAFTIWVLILLLMTSSQDPGIVPRASHPAEEEFSYGRSVIFEGGKLGHQFSRTKQVCLNGLPVTVSYCNTCMIYQPPRSSHCSICNNCVERADHHCPWIGQCIGLRNYRSYFLFVSTTTLLFVFIFVMSALHIKFLVDGDCPTLLEAIKKAPTSLALLIYSFISVLCVGFLSAYHLYLIGTNQTTGEELKNRLEKKQNIYDRGWLNNFAQILCTKTNPSKIDLRGFIQEEAVMPLPVISLPETEDLRVNTRMKVVDRDDIEQDLPKLSPHRNHIEVDLEMGWTERDG